MCQQTELAGFPAQLFSLDPLIAHWLMVLIILLFNTYHNSVEWRNKHLHIVNMIMCGNLYFKKARCSVEVCVHFNLVVQMWRGSRVYQVFCAGSSCVYSLQTRLKPSSLLFLLTENWFLMISFWVTGCTTEEQENEKTSLMFRIRIECCMLCTWVGQYNVNAHYYKCYLCRLQ